MAQIEFGSSLSGTSAPLPHFWEHTVGSGHAPLALRADWQAQLRRCHEELGFESRALPRAPLGRHGHAHPTQGGQLLYSFFNADQIWDFLLSIGMKPFVELSFMPTALASGDTTVFHYAANVTPPRDYQEWANSIRGWSSHWVERYGVAEVRAWFFEVWNEPNLKRLLDRHAGRLLQAVSPHRGRSQRCGRAASRRRPGDGQERMDRGVPRVLRDEWRPGRLRQHAPLSDRRLRQRRRTTPKRSLRRAGAACCANRRRRRAAARRGQPVYYTEWNTSSNPRDPLHDEPYAAAFVVKTVHGGERPGRGLQLLDIHRHLRGELFPVGALPRRLRPAQPARHRQADLPRLRAAAPPRHRTVASRKARTRRWTPGSCGKSALSPFCSPITPCRGTP